jgi:hypothetical protein
VTVIVTHIFKVSAEYTATVSSLSRGELIKRRVENSYRLIIDISALSIK